MIKIFDWSIETHSLIILIVFYLFIVLYEYRNIFCQNCYCYEGLRYLENCFIKFEIFVKFHFQCEMKIYSE